MASKAKPAPVPVTVKALCHLCESGVAYKPGDTFDVEPDRADALGETVELLTEAPPTE